MMGTTCLFIKHSLQFVLLGSCVLAGVMWGLNRRTESVELEPKVKFVDPIAVGEENWLVFTVANRGRRPVSLIGFESGCLCATSEPLPLKIAPYSEFKVKVGVRRKTEAYAPQQISFAFFCDSGTLTKLEGRVVFVPPAKVKKL